MVEMGTSGLSWKGMGDDGTMLTMDELKGSREILDRIDWDMSPQMAFEAYQVKSIDAWKHRGLDEVYHFYIDVWKGRARVLLMRRSLKNAEDVVELPVPHDLVSACLERQVGARPDSGQYPIDEAIGDWLRRELS
jgi:hypothetical protein